MNRKIFWLIWGIAFVPMLSAMGMYYSGIGVPEGRTHNGELVVGSHIDQWQLSKNGQQWQRPERWLLVLKQNEHCSDCEQWREVIPKLIQATGKERERVDWLDLTATGIESSRGISHQLREGVWLVDPLGNLVLHYDAKQSPELVLKDLKKLLKLSKVG